MNFSLQAGMDMIFFFKKATPSFLRILVGCCLKAQILKAWPKKLPTAKIFSGNIWEFLGIQKLMVYRDCLAPSHTGKGKQTPPQNNDRQPLERHSYLVDSAPLLCLTTGVV